MENIRPLDCMASPAIKAVMAKFSTLSVQLEPYDRVPSN